MNNKITKNQYYFNYIDVYFKTIGQQYMQRMIDIIQGNARVSLRLIHWFITRYTRITAPVMYRNYKGQLGIYTKKYFDPFRRGDKFMYRYNINGNRGYLNTSIGQLNFFLWAFNNGIIDYIENNYNMLVTLMTRMK